jgi:16S rRNA U516 pseudouridylate synthase RsuA-like enzyme
MNDAEGTTAGTSEGIRLQKVLAAAGIGSRRACEVLIGEGRVSVNDEVVQEQGRRVDPEVDVIRVDTMRINTARGLVYLAMNKPRGYVTAMSDPEGRPTVGDLVADRVERLFHVGRLDADTEGLLLLTNDGELAHRTGRPGVLGWPAWQSGPSAARSRSTGTTATRSWTPPPSCCRRSWSATA